MNVYKNLIAVRCTDVHDTILTVEVWGGVLRCAKSSSSLVENEAGLSTPLLVVGAVDSAASLLSTLQAAS